MRFLELLSVASGTQPALGNSPASSSISNTDAFLAQLQAALSAPMPAPGNPPPPPWSPPPPGAPPGEVRLSVERGELKTAEPNAPSKKPDSTASNPEAETQVAAEPPAPGRTELPTFETPLPSWVPSTIPSFGLTMPLGRPERSIPPRILSSAVKSEPLADPHDAQQVLLALNPTVTHAWRRLEVRAVPTPPAVVNHDAATPSPVSSNVAMHLAPSGVFPSDAHVGFDPVAPPSPVGSNIASHPVPNPAAKPSVTPSGAFLVASTSPDLSSGSMDSDSPSGLPTEFRLGAKLPTPPPAPPVLRQSDELGVKPDHPSEREQLSATPTRPQPDLPLPSEPLGDFSVHPETTSAPKPTHSPRPDLASNQAPSPSGPVPLPATPYEAPIIGSDSGVPAVVPSRKVEFLRPTPNDPPRDAQTFAKAPNVREPYRHPESPEAGETETRISVSESMPRPNRIEEPSVAAPTFRFEDKKPRPTPEVPETTTPKTAKVVTPSETSRFDLPLTSLAEDRVNPPVTNQPRPVVTEKVRLTPVGQGDTSPFASPNLTATPQEFPGIAASPAPHGLPGDPLARFPSAHTQSSEPTRAVSSPPVHVPIAVDRVQKPFLEELPERSVATGLGLMEPPHGEAEPFAPLTSAPALSVETEGAAPKVPIPSDETPAGRSVDPTPSDAVRPFVERTETPKPDPEKPLAPQSNRVNPLAVEMPENVTRAVASTMRPTSIEASSDPQPASIPRPLGESEPAELAAKPKLPKASHLEPGFPVPANAQAQPAPETTERVAYSAKSSDHVVTAPDDASAALDSSPDERSEQTPETTPPPTDSESGAFRTPPATESVRASEETRLGPRTDRPVVEASSPSRRDLPWLDQVDQMRARMHHGLQIELNPRDLGPLMLTLEQQGNEIQAHFASDNEQVRAALSAAQPSLGKALEDRGLTIRDFTVSASMSDRSSPQDQSQAQSRPTPMRFAPSEPTSVPTPLLLAAPKSGRGLDLSI